MLTFSFLPFSLVQSILTFRKLFYVKKKKKLARGHKTPTKVLICANCVSAANTVVGWQDYEGNKWVSKITSKIVRGVGCGGWCPFNGVRAPHQGIVWQISTDTCWCLSNQWLEDNCTIALLFKKLSNVFRHMACLIHPKPLTVLTNDDPFKKKKILNWSKFTFCSPLIAYLDSSPHPTSKPNNPWVFQSVRKFMHVYRISA